jgi:hypothetical protein
MQKGEHKKLRIDLDTLNRFAKHQLTLEEDAQIARYLARHTELLNRLPQPIRGEVGMRLRGDSEASSMESDCSDLLVPNPSHRETPHASTDCRVGRCRSRSKSIAIPAKQSDLRGQSDANDCVARDDSANKLSAVLIPQPSSVQVAVAESHPKIQLEKLHVTSRKSAKKRRPGFNTELIANLLAHAIPPVLTIAFGYYWLVPYYSDDTATSAILIEAMPNGVEVYVDEKRMETVGMSDATRMQLHPGRHEIKVVRANGMVSTNIVHLRRNEEMTVDVGTP